MTSNSIEQVQLYEQKTQDFLTETRRAATQHLSSQAKSAAADCQKAAELTTEAASGVIEQYQEKANDLELSAWQAARCADTIVAALIDPPEPVPRPVPEKPKQDDNFGPKM